MESMDEAEMPAESDDMEMEIEAFIGDSDDDEGEEADENPDHAAAAAAAAAIEFAVPVFRNGRFRNPWKSNQKTKFKSLFKCLFFARDESWIPRKEELDRTLPVIQPDLTEYDEMPISGVRHMWIGHASSLVQFDGVTFLTDPMFSDRCSPVQFMGLKRFRPTPCTVSQLPQVDFVLISHCHYDHLDHSTVMALNEKFGIGLRWYVPMGLKKWMSSCGCANVVEMTWWQEDIYHENLNITIACTPAQHWSRRSGNDENKVLWCSWCVLGPKHNFFFSGDSGYCEAFKQIGKRYGPFSLSTLPIGAYSPRESLSCMHLDPAQAVDAHIDLQSESSIGIHWGTFALTSEPYLEPKELLEAEIQKRGMQPCSFFTVKHGKISIVGEDDLNEID